MDEEYIELQEWKINQNAPELTHMPKFILAKKDGGESFKRNFIIYLMNYFFSGSKNRYCSNSVLKYVKDHAHEKEKEKEGLPNKPTEKGPLKRKFGKNNIDKPLTKKAKREKSFEHMLMDQAKKEMNNDGSIPSFNIWLGLSQPDNQSPSTYVPDPKTAREKHHTNEDDDDANHDLSIKKTTENKSKARDKPSSKNGDVRNPAIRIKEPTTQGTTSSKAPSPHTAKDQPQQSKQAVSLKGSGRQHQSGKTERTSPPKDKSPK
ncbi:LOW QUALITY PROTEIN: hypothetical protein Cgig2_000644 [Carnegiea gigantea]|uniref:Uncharacterized protein n=1 Tax=Carnegiea gigantea TaxID=171969 RepID=A0A9Q1JTG1_9CARY|nr:LOW QUALITY PROTEIN: hypothetical protein Cgig2_000644 [Carnegiea gigantea]